MPRKKTEKPIEQRLAESFFPVEPKDVKYSVEKKHNPLGGEITQKLEKPKIKKQANRKKKIVRKSKNSEKNLKKNNLKEFTPAKINLKKDSYELIITEKPQAASKIASFLGKAVKKNMGSVPYYEIDRKGKKILVACAVGHLFSLTKKGRDSVFPVFNLHWVPNYFVKKNDFSKKYYDVLLRLSKNAGSLTIATDYDVEGEVIGMNVVRFIAGQNDASRMKFSTLTEKEINLSYDLKSEHINWGQAIAGETRHYLDWIYGINLSRALMSAISSTGKFRVMSIGRIQGPTLKIIVDKEKKIREFKPKKYWQVFITIKDFKNNFEAELKYVKDIFKKEELSIFRDLIGKKVLAKTEKASKFVPPNPPFNLTALQTEAYRVFGFSPSKTLQVAQSLYLNGVISYPRTSSQKLPASIGYEEILKKLSKEYKTEKLTIRKNPVEGNKTDSAHPSIFPTGNSFSMNSDETKLYDLIVKRFLSLFCEDAIIDSKTISAEINNLKFSVKGSSVSKKSWMEIYPFKIDEKFLPDMKGEFEIVNSRTEEKETQPSKRYSPASLISELEKRNLGTKATRAAIIETLYLREYARGKNIEATPLGISLVSILEKYSPIIVDEKLTREFEKEMEIILESKKNFEEGEKKVIEKAKDTISEIIFQFSENKNKIGEELLDSSDTLREQKREENKFQTICPLCKKGNLAVSYSKKTKRYFVACSAYPDCKNTYSLPPNGLAKKSDEFCNECGFQKVMLIKKGRKPWIFCFNRDCSVNKERIEEYRRKKENL